MGSNKYWCIGHRVFSRWAVIVIVSVYRLRGAEEKERRKDKRKQQRAKRNSSNVDCSTA
jgi:hypothetical protein